MALCAFQGETAAADLLSPPTKSIDGRLISDSEQSFDPLRAL